MFERSRLKPGDVQALARATRNLRPSTGTAPADEDPARLRQLVADFCKLLGAPQENPAARPVPAPHAKLAPHARPAPREISATPQTPAPLVELSIPVSSLKVPASTAPVLIDALPPPVVAPHPKLPPRLQQTLSRLLMGDSEKQIARHLNLSPHTIHAYIKDLHKRYGVCSRGELLARFITPPR